MADGSFKAIEKVRIGELVLGRYGEANEVLALDRTVLGTRPLYQVNGEHWTTGEHPHWTDEGPVAVDPRELRSDWGNYHPVVLANGRVEEWLNTGLTRPVRPLRIGMRACHGEGLKEIRSIAVVPGHPNLPLYNLVLGGSHTMRVDGYLVTGWPQEHDFDYDLWQPKPVRYLAPRRVRVLLARDWLEPQRRSA
jgi:hypothetical protein